MEAVFKGGLRKGFSWWPVKLTKTGKISFLKPIYYRFCEYEPFGDPDRRDWFEHYTPEETAIMVLRDEGHLDKGILPFERFVMKVTSDDFVHCVLLGGLVLLFIIG